MFRFLRWRASETSFGFLFDVSNVVFLNFLMDWFSNHWIFKESIEHSQTWLVLSHGSIQMRRFRFWSWTRDWVSSWFTSLSLIKLFRLNRRLKTSLNFFFFLSLLLIAQMLNFSFSILNVFVHSVDEFLFLGSCHLFTKLSSCSFNFHCFKFLLEL